MGNRFFDALLGRKSDRTPVVLRRFGVADDVLSRDVLAVEEDHWLVDAPGNQLIRLFEVSSPDAERCILTYRAVMQSEELAGRAYLEMWCRFPGRGEFFSRGLNQPLQGSVRWTPFETPFRLRKGERPDLIKLNLVVEGAGKIRIKDVELLKTPA